jgi:hypothetical protein
MSKTATSRKMLRPMTPEAVEVAARADRDAQPLPPADLKRMKRTPQAKIIRRALALTQKNFLSPTTHSSGHSPGLGARSRGTGPTNASLSQGHCARSRARRAALEFKAAVIQFILEALQCECRSIR